MSGEDVQYRERSAYMEREDGESECMVQCARGCSVHALLLVLK